MTDDSAFKNQVRARMAETGEKYTAARRMVILEAAIRDAVQGSIEQAVGLSAVDIDLTADPVKVTIRAARPEVAWGLHRPRETDGIWRESAAEQLHRELEELAGRRVRLTILQRAEDARRGAAS